jgi:shikimate kinase
MIGRGMARSAGTVVNAIATGKGAAFGIDLRTEAEVELNDTGKIDVLIEGAEGESTRLVELCVLSVLERYGEQGRGARVVTRSQIPISKGLKSSSAAANAVIKATLRALDEDLQLLEAIEIGCHCAIQAGVSVTGAFDDACASMMGGLVITDNTNFELVDRERMDPSLVALIHTPHYQIRKGTLPLDRIRNISDLVEIAYILVQKGEYATAMKLNGLAYASVLGVDPSVMHEALARGAVAAGISGTGPATVILVGKDRAEALRSEMSVAKDILVANVYNCD